MARKIFHTKDSTEVLMRRRCGGTHTMVAARAGIQKHHDDKMARGMAMTKWLGKSAHLTRPSSKVRQETMVAVNTGEKQSWSSMSFPTVDQPTILLTYLNHANKMGVIQAAETNAATVASW